MTIQLIVNGTHKTFEKDELHIADVLEAEGMSGLMVAVAHNNVVVPKAQWQCTILSDGDVLEIVAPMQGG